MTTTMILTYQAKVDTLEISEWYESQTPETGERFLQALDNQFDSILKSPTIYRLIGKSEIRRCKLNRWPYQIFFTQTGDCVEIIAIIHTSRDPRYIAYRTSS